MIKVKQARRNVATAYSSCTRNPTNETQEELNGEAATRDVL